MAVLASQERAFQQGRAMAQRGARFGQGQGQGQGREEKKERDRLSDGGSLDEEGGEGQEEEGRQTHDRYVRVAVSRGRWEMMAGVACCVCEGSVARRLRQREGSTFPFTLCCVPPVSSANGRKSYWSIDRSHFTCPS